MNYCETLPKLRAPAFHWADGPLLCLEPLRVSSNELCLGGMAWSRHLSRLCGLPQPLTSVCFMTSGRNDDEEPYCGILNTKCSNSVRDMRQQLGDSYNNASHTFASVSPLGCKPRPRRKQTMVAVASGLASVCPIITITAIAVFCHQHSCDQDI